MVLFNHSTHELTAKIVYYGPGLCGKTTNLRVLHERLEKGTAGRLLSLATAQDRTIYFDLLPVELGNIKGYTVRFQLCTVPGQVFYNETRKLVLRGVDGVVFVVDSQWSMLSHNLESFQNLAENLRDLSVGIESIPIVIQYNKRDLPGVLSVDALQESLGFTSYPFVEAVASTGQGVVETFKLVSKLTFVDLLRRLQRAGGIESDVFSVAAGPDQAEPGDETVARRGPAARPSSFASDRTPAAAIAEKDQPFDTDPAWVPPVESDVFAVSAPEPLPVPGPDPFALAAAPPSPVPAPAPEAVATVEDLEEESGPATIAVSDPALRVGLDRHEAALAELRAALDAQGSALEEHRAGLQNALDGQRVALETHRAELRDALEAQGTALESQRAEMTRLLEGTRATLVPRAEHEAALGELKELRSAADALRDELRSAADALREELRSARTELGGHLEGLASQLNERLSAVGADLFAARAEAERARADLQEAHRALAEKVEALAAEGGDGKLAEALRPHEEARAQLQRRLDAAEEELARSRAVTQEAHRLIDERLGAAERRTRGLAEAIRRALENLSE